jgi:hypothetical protein
LCFNLFFFLISYYFCFFLSFIFQVGGIFVRIFNQSPTLPLNPSDFLSHLLTSVLAEYPSVPETFPVLIEAIYNILSLQPSLISQAGSDDQAKLQSVVSLVLDNLRTRTTWDDLRLLKHFVMIIRLFANSKTSPLLSFNADKVVAPLVKVFFYSFFVSLPISLPQKTSQNTKFRKFYINILLT